MKSVFDRISGAIAQRSAVYKDITHQFSLVRQDKLATSTDLFESFKANPRLSDALDAKGGVSLWMMKNAIKSEQIPNSLLKTASRENIEQQYREFESSPENVAKARKVLDEVNAILARGGVSPIDADVMKRPTSAHLFWVDDFLAAADSILNLKWTFKLSAYVYGDGEKTLEVVNNLRNLPDYSSHFPPRPRALKE
jgi:hypothetical protein